MDVLASLYHFGVEVVLDPYNIFYCFIGVLSGTLIGVLPGIGPLGGIALLLPLTFYLPPTSGIIMLAGFYNGIMYGGSTTSILVNIPGETASIVTCLDGHEMAKQGRAGPALGIAAIGSWIGGTFGLICLMFLAYYLAEFAMKFGPPEYFTIMATGMVFLTYLSRAPARKTWLMIGVGLFLGTIGQDEITGKLRFDFGLPELAEGIHLVPFAMGLFGVSEILLNLEKPFKRTIYSDKIKNLLPSRQDWKESIAPIIRGSLLGFAIGILPGGQGTLSSFASYALEKKTSKHPERFGKGAIAGVAGPETSNNAATSGNFVPFLALGIPSNGTMAIFLAALMMHGIVPGPLLITNQPDVFWGVIGSMYMANIMLLILNLPLIGIWVKILKVPYQILFPIILLFCLLGAYVDNYSAFDIYVLVFFGIIGYILRKLGYPMAPLILARVLGPRIELSFFQSMVIAKGRLSIFFTRPYACVLMILGILLIAHTLFKYIWKHLVHRDLSTELQYEYEDEI
jgi:putative tricarboxylic transport membrane protein